tara:strand:- start:204 stop:398 length:195 start_codon:yes stop_codon:yes gene_type:complete
MNSEKSQLINDLISIEDRIDELWEYHPENPNAIDVVDMFNELQSRAISLTQELEELDGEKDDLI